MTVDDATTGTGTDAADPVLAATGRDLDAWRAELDSRGAADLDHAAVARLVESLLPGGMDGNRGWWAQNVTVRYEQLIGRRVEGQTCAGDFSVSASRTVRLGKDDAVAAWARIVADHLAANGGAVDGVPAGEPRTSESEKWRYWKLDLADGTRVEVTVTDKPGDGPRAVVGVGHNGLASGGDRDRWRPVWKALLAEL